MLFEKTYFNKKVLVTGSNGFKGAWLCYWLYKLKAEVIGIGLKNEENNLLFNKLLMDKKIQQVYLDITNFEKLNKLVKKNNPDIIFHLAAQSIVSESYSNPIKTFNTNLNGSLNVLEVFRKNKIKNLIYVTSDKCYLNKEKKVGYTEDDELGGKDPYSSSKAAAEFIFKSYFNNYFVKNKKLKLASLRAGNVIGGGDFKKDRLIPDIVKSIKNNKKFFLRNPNSVRPWQHVLEPTYAYLLVGHYLMVNKLSSKIKPHWNFGPKRKNCITVMKMVKNFFSHWKIKKKILTKKKLKFKENKILFLNIKKSKKELKWFPKLDVKESLKMTVDLYKAIIKNQKIDKILNGQIENYKLRVK